MIKVDGPEVSACGDLAVRKQSLTFSYNGSFDIPRFAQLIILFLKQPDTVLRAWTGVITGVKEVFARSRVSMVSA
jgi:hypothetical protein